MKLEQLVNKYYNTLNENDIYIWNYIRDHKKECEKLVIDELAKRCNVSRTTILRFAKKLSLKGYGELKVYIKLDNEITKENTDNLTMLYNSYNRLMETMRDKDLSQIFKDIKNAENLYVFGIGMMQASIKNEIKRLFLRTGLIFYDIRGNDEAESILNIITEKDLCIVISVSGENADTISFVKKLQVRNTCTISITKMKNNSLSEICRYNLYISSLVINNNLEKYKYESLTSYFMLIEILFVKYQQYILECERKSLKNEN